MNKSKISMVTVLLFFLALSAYSDDLMPATTGCEAQLMEYLPVEVDTSSLGMRATVKSMNQPFLPTQEMRRKQLTEQFETSEKYQKMFPTLEDFIETMTKLINEDGESLRETAAVDWQAEVIVSKSNVYARYFSSADLNTPTQEIVLIKRGKREWHSICINHVKKEIVKSTIKHANEYASYFVALTPQEAHRKSWIMYKLMLNMEGFTNSVVQILCETGQIKFPSLTLSYEFTDNDHCIFKTQAPVPAGELNTEYELKHNSFIRLQHYQLIGPELSTEVSYSYENPASPWPSKQHLIDRNILSNQTLQDRTMEILDVAPVEKWDFNKIQNALMKKYSDYPYVQK